MAIEDPRAFRIASTIFGVVALSGILGAYFGASSGAPFVAVMSFLGAAISYVASRERFELLSHDGLRAQQRLLNVLEHMRLEGEKGLVELRPDQFGFIGRDQDECITCGVGTIDFLIQYGYAKNAGTDDRGRRRVVVAAR